MAPWRLRDGCMEGRLGPWGTESACQLPQQCQQDALAPPIVEAFEVQGGESVSGCTMRQKNGVKHL